MCKSAKPSQFLCHETGKNFFWSTPLGQAFLDLYRIYYEKQQLNKPKRVCDNLFLDIFNKK